jgi:hypothetical protein
MLKLLIAAGGSGGGGVELKYDMTIMQLRQFLDNLIERGILESIDGLYSCCRK